MRFGARNQIRAKVKKIKRGKAMGQVSVQLIDRGQMTSVMTLDSIKELGIKPGSEVLILVKAINVLLARVEKPRRAKRR